MFARVMFSTLAAASLASARPALAQNDPDSGRELHANAATIAECRDANACCDPAATARPDALAAQEGQGASRDEAAEPSFFGPSGAELNAFGGA